jgi:predicted nucleic acid-binding protein
MAGKIVVDSSVLIKWIKTKDEELLAEARRLLRQVETKPLTVHVPALLLYETGNILLLKTDLDPDGLEKAVENLETLPFVVAPPATPLLRRAAQLDKEFTLTFYDASFLALAVELDCPLVTADGRFSIAQSPCPAFAISPRLAPCSVRKQRLGVTLDIQAAASSTMPASGPFDGLHLPHAGIRFAK